MPAPPKLWTGCWKGPFRVSGLCGDWGLGEFVPNLAIYTTSSTAPARLHLPGILPAFIFPVNSTLMISLYFKGDSWDLLAQVCAAGAFS